MRETTATSTEERLGATAFCKQAADALATGLSVRSEAAQCSRTPHTREADRLRLSEKMLRSTKHSLRQLQPMTPNRPRAAPQVPQRGFQPVAVDSAAVAFAVVPLTHAPKT